MLGCKYTASMSITLSRMRLSTRNLTNLSLSEGWTLYTPTFCLHISSSIHFCLPHLPSYCCFMLFVNVGWERFHTDASLSGFLCTDTVVVIYSLEPEVYSFQAPPTKAGIQDLVLPFSQHSQDVGCFIFSYQISLVQQNHFYQQLLHQTIINIKSMYVQLLYPRSSLISEL